MDERLSIRLRRFAASGVGLTDEERLLLSDAANEIDSLRGLPGPGAGRLALRDLDTRSEDFAMRVEEAWWDEMQGELRITGEDPDRLTRDLVGILGEYGAQHVLQVGDSVDQFGGDGEPLPQNVVTPEEVARRVARAIALVCYGGK